MSKGFSSGVLVIIGNDNWMVVYYGGVLGLDFYWLEGLLIYDFNWKKFVFYIKFDIELVGFLFFIEEYFVFKCR